MTVNFKLVTPDATEYDIDYSGTAFSSNWQELPGGIGLPNIAYVASESAYRDGAQVSRSTIPARMIDVPVSIFGESLDGALSGLKRYYQASKFRRSDLTPCKIKATGAGGTAYMDVYPTGEALRQDMYGKVNKIALRFAAFKPYWYYGTETSTGLTAVATVNLPYIAKRSVTAAGTVWNTLGTGMDSIVYAIEPSGSNLYVGGNFTTAGGGTVNRVAKWDGTAWSALGTGMNGIVYALASSPDGSLYAGGAFVTAGGGTVNKIAKWGGTAWSALSTGMNDTVRALTVAPNGDLYAGGLFTLAGGGTATLIAKWNGSAWSSVGGGLAGGTDRVFALAASQDGRIYAGGNFVTAGGGTVNNVAVWNGTAWSALGTGTNGDVNALTIDSGGNLYAGGFFTTASGGTVNYISKWNGAAWSVLGTGTNTVVYTIATDESELLYAGGVFTTAGGRSVNDRMALWNGSRWQPVDLDLAGTPTVFSIKANDYGVFVGFDANAASSSSAYATSINNTGNTVRPKFVITGPGVLQTIKNETTGHNLWFDATLQAGETLTIDCDALTVSSSWRGNLLSSLVPGGDFSTFVLDPGVNLISMFMTGLGAGASAFIKYTAQFDTLAEAIG